MTSDKEKVYQAIILDPFDRVAKQAYADIVEEEGDLKHTKFMRVSMAFKMSNNHNAYCHTPWDCNCRYPTGDLKNFDHENYWTWSGGFLKAIVCPIGVFLSIAKEMFGKHPITNVIFSDKPPRRVTDGEETVFKYQFYEITSQWLRRSNSLPMFLRDLVPANLVPPPGRKNTKRICYYASWWAATYAVSDAAVSYGRRLAGLPDLNFKKSVAIMG